ncbi:MAG TPA: O-antigen ligase family protein [Candidatus Thermoplasmatota archaeon]|nr:O-antigen ligase family protein [Candidatus Thermoplasmatota archaeon]
MVEGSPIDRTVLSILLSLGILIVIKRNYNWINALKHNLSVLLLIGFMLLSISWSDMPSVSFKRWIRNCIPIVMAFVISTESDPKSSMQCLFRRMIYIHIPFSLMLIKYYPHLGVDYGRWSGKLMWIGVNTQKNGLAFLCMFALFYFIWTFIRRWQGRDISVVCYQTYIEIFIVLLATWLFAGPNHTLTYSATSTASLAVGLIALIGLMLLKKQNIVIGANELTILIVAIIVYGTFTPFVGHLMVYDPSRTLGREETLTGRSDIWERLVPYATQKPLLGHGFGGFWTDKMRSETDANAHNGYLDTILNTGFVGLLFLSMFLISNCRRAQGLMSRDFDWGVLWFCFILMAVAHNIAESSMMSLTGPLSAVLLLMLISSPSGAYKQTEHKAKHLL